eukprot:2321224-Prymnesium_polylepis.1
MQEAMEVTSCLQKALEANEEGFRTSTAAFDRPGRNSIMLDSARRQSARNSSLKSMSASMKSSCGRGSAIYEGDEEEEEEEISDAGSINSLSDRRSTTSVDADLSTDVDKTVAAKGSNPL